MLIFKHWDSAKSEYSELTSRILYLAYFYDKYSHRGLGKIHSLKDQTHDVRHLNDFSAHQTEFLVIIEYSVHVLDPHGVDRAIKQHPLPVRGVC